MDAVQKFLTANQVCLTAPTGLGVRFFVFLFFLSNCSYATTLHGKHPYNCPRINAKYYHKTEGKKRKEERTPIALRPGASTNWAKDSTELTSCESSGSSANDLTSRWIEVEEVAVNDSLTNQNVDFSSLFRMFHPFLPSYPIFISSISSISSMPDSFIRRVRRQLLIDIKLSSLKNGISNAVFLVFRGITFCLE